MNNLTANVNIESMESDMQKNKETFQILANIWQNNGYSLVYKTFQTMHYNSYGSLKSMPMNFNYLIK